MFCCWCCRGACNILVIFTFLIVFKMTWVPPFPIETILALPNDILDRVITASGCNLSGTHHKLVKSSEIWFVHNTLVKRYLSESYLKIKSCKILFVHNMHVRCPTIWKFCTEHGSFTACCMQLKSATRWSFKTNSTVKKVMGEWGFM